MENHFQTKHLIVIGFILIIIGLVYLPNLKNLKDDSVPMTAMSGTITEVEGSLIKVKGMVGGEEKEVKFTISPETVLKKTTFGITLEQIKSGKPYSPETKIEIGKLSDLASNIAVSKIISKENLVVKKSATAVEIHYFIYDTPTAPTN